MHNMLTSYLTIFILLSVIAEILGTAGGLGASVFFVPMTIYIMDFQTVLGITVLFHLASNLTKIGFFTRGYDKKLVLYLGIPAVHFVALGAYLSKFVHPNVLNFIPGTFLLVSGLIFLMVKNVKIEANKKNAVVEGCIVRINDRAIRNRRSQQGSCDDSL